MKNLQKEIENTKKLENKMKGKYLTEEFLGEFLKVAYPNQKWIHDEKFQIPNTEKLYKFKPDYCCHALKMCVEFDGPDHFTKANVIQTDENKDKVLQNLDYKIIRIPYFIQLDYFSIQHFFNIDFPFNYGFPHGFVSPSVVLPSSFCEQGIWKFKNIISILDLYKETGYIFDQISESLITKITNKSKKVPLERAILNVIPSSLTFDLRLEQYNQAVKNNHNIAKNSSNCQNYILLESSQLIKNIAGVYNLIYIYNTDGSLLGYSFEILHNNTIQKHEVTLKISNKSTATIGFYKEGVLLNEKEKELSNIGIEDIMRVIFHI